MLRGIDITASGLAAQVARQEVLANNLANINSVAFKAQRSGTVLSFAEELLQRLDETGNAPIGRWAAGTQLKVYSNWEQGNLEQTGKQTDLALEGAGFLAVEAPEGVYYTRDGELHVDADGYLANSRGEIVLGQAGPIYVGEGKLEITPVGEVLLDGFYLDTLQLVELQGEPVRTGNGRFQAPAGEQPVPITARVLQGYLERSNVELAGEMVNSIAALRAYQANQRLLTVQDELLGKVVREVGSLR